MRIKEKYKNLKHNGVLYNLGGYSEEKLKMIWDTNPQLRYAFEEEEKIAPIKKEFVEEPHKFEDELINLGIDTEEKFEDAIKNVTGKRYGKGIKKK